MIKRFNTTVLICLCLTQQLHATLCENTFGYISQPLSHTTGLMMLGGYRSYNAVTGNFTKQDGYSAFQSNRTFNGFNYAVENPVLLTDRSGHLPAWAWGFIAGSAIVVIGAGVGFAAWWSKTNALKTEITSLNTANTLLTGKVTDLEASHDAVAKQMGELIEDLDTFGQDTENTITQLNERIEALDKLTTKHQYEINTIQKIMRVQSQIYQEARAPHFGWDNLTGDEGFSQEDIQKATRRSMNPLEVPPSASGASSSWQNPELYRR